METNRFASLNRRKFLQIAGLGAAAGPMLGALAGAQAKEMSASPTADNPVTEALRWPERGNFAYKPLVSPHQPSAAAMLSPRHFFGLEREGIAMYGCLRDIDGEMYEICRRLPGDNQGGLTGLFLESTVGRDTLHIVPEASMQAATSIGMVTRLDDGNAVWTSAPAAPGKPFKVTLSSDGSRCTWVEEGLCDLEGELIGPGLQWYLPGADTSMFYVSQIFQMHGRLKGKPVRGMIGFDDMYLPRGVLLYGGKDPLTGHQEHRCWYTWATRYKDGSVDAGHFMLGHDRLGFALLTNEHQQLVLDTDVSGAITQGPDKNWPQSIRIKAGGSEWEFLPDAKGKMPDLLGGNQQAVTPQNEGRWRRVGDTREPDVWFAWGEIAPAHGLNYQQRLRY